MIPNPAVIVPKHVTLETRMIPKSAVNNVLNVFKKELKGSPHIKRTGTSNCSSKEP